MRDLEFEVMLDYVGRDITHMLELFDEEGNLADEDTMRYGAECIVYKLEDNGISTPETREEVTAAMVELVKRLHREGR